MLSREDALAGWRCFLGRTPPEDDLPGYQACGSRAELVRQLTMSGEFQNRVSSGATTLLDAVSAFNAATRRAFDVPGYFAPTTLSRTGPAIGAVLLIGNCLFAEWSSVLQQRQPGLIADLVSFGDGGDHQRRLPRPIKDYDCQLWEIPLRIVLPESELMRLASDDLAGYEGALARSIDRLSAHLETAFRGMGRVPMFVANYPVPQQQGHGRLLPRHDLRNPTYFIEMLNRALADMVEAQAGAYLLDIDQLAGSFGRRFVQYDAFWLYSHGGLMGDDDFNSDGPRLEPSQPASTRYPLDITGFIASAWAEVTAMTRTLAACDQIKLVCVDLDDTLWRGALADSAFVDAASVEGWPLGFAEALAMLRRRGIILAIISKNDEARIAEIWPRIFDLRLTLDDFAIRKINWRPKADNVAEAIAEAEVPASSVLFIDDNPVERAAVAEAIPEIRTLGGPHLDWRRILLWSSETQIAARPKRSSRRGSVVGPRIAGATRGKKGTRSEMLAELGVAVTLARIKAVDTPQFARALKLLNKSDQFNTTGRRWSHDEAAAHFAAGGIWWGFTVADKSSDYGLVGVVVQAGATIDQFAMSSRVFGLGAETAALSAIVEHMLADGANEISAALVATERNAPCRKLYAHAGWIRKGGFWRTDTTPAPPSHINLSVVD